MKKTLITISATTALWAVVGYSAIHFEWLFVLTRSDVSGMLSMFNGMQEQMQEVLQAYWTCKHST